MPNTVTATIITTILLFCTCTVYKPYLKFDETKKLVLLTFDDGPNDHKNTTREILKVLKKHKVKALFNLIGANVDRYPATTREIHNDGHIIANHGYTVLPVLFRSRKKIAWEVDSCTSALQRALRDSLYKPLYFRPSMGWFNRRTVTIVKKRGMLTNGLTLYAIDTRKHAGDVDKIIKTFVKGVEKHNGGVVVLHDGIAEYTHLEKRLGQNWKNYDRSFIPVVTDSLITILTRKGFSFPRLNGKYPNDLSEDEKRTLKDVVY